MPRIRGLFVQSGASGLRHAFDARDLAVLRVDLVDVPRNITRDADGMSTNSQPQRRAFSSFATGSDVAHHQAHADGTNAGQIE